MKCVWAVLLLAASARGDVVTYEFSGTVQRTVNGDVLFGDLPVGIGDVISGTVRYDTAAADQEAAMDHGFYHQTAGVAFEINGRHFASSSYDVQVLDNVVPFGPSPIDAFLFLVGSLEMEGNPVDGVFVLQLVDLTATALSGDVLIPIDFGDFAAPYNFTQGELSDFGPALPVGLSFSIDRFRLVPEPGSLALVAIGAFFLRRRG